MDRSSKKYFPLLPLKDAVVFPYANVTFKVGRDFSKKAIEAALKDDFKEIVVVAQKNSSVEMPGYDDIYNMGTLCTVIQVIEGPGGVYHVFLEGEKRVRIEDFTWRDDAYATVRAEIVETDKKKQKEVQKFRAILETALNDFVDGTEFPQEFITETLAIEDDERFVDFVIVGFINMKIEENQRLLSTINLEKRYQQVISILKIELELRKIEEKIDKNVKKKIEKNQREYFLNEQMNAIKSELENGDDGNRRGGKKEKISEEEALKQKIKALDAPEFVREKLWEEFERMQMLPQMSSESGVSRTYIDILLSLPWNKKSKTQIDLKLAEEILEKEHFGLEDVKKRVVEYLAVLKLNNSLKAPIICLVGPPGVGKTSIAGSIARATGREFVRQSLGGIKDEAEIRGHRRTYIGSMPGKIIQSVKKAKVRNPLFLLDEIDKLGSDYKGDPASALLEVLDPEQNATFIDHYIDLEFDLSDVLFVATANDEQLIPRALRDRLEIIRIEGYTYYEKKNIALKYLVEKQKKFNGIANINIDFTEKGLQRLIDSYTSEAGVRELERKIAAICRRVAYERAKNEFSRNDYAFDSQDIESYLGPELYNAKADKGLFEVGVVNGLAWTAYGGTLLKIEVLKYPGKGNVKTTGSLGAIMKESVEAAISFVRSIGLPVLAVEPDLWDKFDLHIHFPEGAVPKDGPSAGVAISLAIASVVSGLPVKPSIAMTGEITLRGDVLKIGGLQAKAMAAIKAGIKKIYIPKDNLPEIKKMPEEISSAVEFIPVEKAETVIKQCLQFKRGVSISKKMKGMGLQQ